MNFILTMTFSGSVMALLCIGLGVCLRGRVSARMEYGMWKVCLLYYLIPLPFLKKLYQAAAARLGEGRGMDAVREAAYVWHGEIGILVGRNRNAYSPALREQLLFAGIWLGGAFIVFCCRMAINFRGRRRLERLTLPETSEDRECRERFQKKNRVLRRVQIRCSPLEGESFTVGMWRPLVVYPDKALPQEREMILRHELTHVRRGDMLWQILMAAVLGIHWLNPFAWFLSGRLRQSCECSCDEEALQGRSRQERRHYAQILVNQAFRKGDKTARVAFSELRGRKKNRDLEERVRRIMRMPAKKRLGKAASIIIIASAAVLNSATVFAYKDVKIVGMDGWELTDELCKEFESGRSAVVVRNSADDIVPYELLLEPETFEYDIQFTDENGGVYPLEDSILSLCEHTYYDSGEILKHEEYADGNCKILIGEGKRCRQCGYVVKEKLIQKNLYNPCIHRLEP